MIYLQEDRIPKIFISYSWSSDALVVDLANRLVSHGVDVVLDKWDLKEGQDKYAFMEQCVNNPEITKVLIVCDKQYAKKADDRTGGVGDETVIISSEVYGNMKQEKFIPIIAEKDEDGKPCVPTYIKTRIYIDLSDENTYEAEYEKLLRNIYEKPLFTKPKLGKKPEWLDEEKTDFFPLKDLIKQIKGSSTDNKRRSCIARFRSEYIEAMKTFWVKGVKADQEYELFLYTKPARDLFLDFVEVVAESDSDYAELLAETFEEMYNTFTCVKTFDVGTMSGSDNDVDVFKIHIWELFICVIAYMRHVRDYKSINVVLTYTYFLNESIFGGNAKIKNYTEFRHHSRPIEDVYKPTTDQKQKFTLLGDVICNQREKLPIYTKNAIAEADLFLYQVCNGLNLPEETKGWRGDYWFPTFYVYVQNTELEWGKLRSKRYCEKMMALFGVENIEDLKIAIGKCEYNRDMRYSGSFDAASSILNYIKVDDIGTLN